MTDIKIHPAIKLNATVTNVLMAKGKDFLAEPVGALPLTYEGIEGDFHAGLTRNSGGREPWYERGTEMRNERQVSILSEEELTEIGDRMGARIEPGWIGANLVLEGVPQLSFLPPRTLMFFENGVTLRVDGYNAPCRLAGGAIAEKLGRDPVEGDYKRTDTALSFKEAAHMKRGLVAWVEREGTITPGEKVSLRIWPQWIYPGA